MRNIFFKAVLSLVFLNIYFLHNLFAISEWSLLIYIQADKRLSGYVMPDVAAIVKAHRMASVNPMLVDTLVQVDYPEAQKIWRFKIDKDGKFDDAYLSEEIEMHSVEELVKSAKWVKAKYPANHYALILCNNGSGTDAYRSSTPELLIYKKNNDRLRHSKLENKFSNQKRGMFPDDSQGTCLRNEDITNALSQIKEVFGKKIDLIWMNTCFMATVEIAYQIKDHANILVASQQIDPAYGWVFDRFLPPLISDPCSFNVESLARLIVSAYGVSYTESCTQSAMKLKWIDLLCDKIDEVTNKILECLNYRSTAVISALKFARSSSLEFDNKNYIDLYCFYRQLNEQISVLHTEVENASQSCCFTTPTCQYFAALDSLSRYLSEGMLIIRSVAFENVANGNMRDANGISIYFPISKEKIHKSYPKTVFAQRFPRWLELLKKFN